jgi:hypothetical protein
MSKIDVASSEYAELCTNEGHQYFLLEYHNVAESVGADIGIYDDTDGVFKNYKMQDGAFVEVN